MFSALSSFDGSAGGQTTAEWQKTFFSATHTNFAVFMVLFMFCTIEVVIMKIATAAADDADYSSEYEEDIYYEEQNNYRRRRHNGIYFY